MNDPIDYQELIYEALRHVVRRALLICADGGLQGHCFYLSFSTQAPGVFISPELVARYPDVMTIVIENQFWDLVVDEEAFSVTLSFSGHTHSLTIPFAAVTTFADPPAEFSLQFGPPEEVVPKPGPTPFGKTADTPFGKAAVAKAAAAGPAPAKKKGEPRQAEVVSIDAFRKR
jgi:hypothetical protein